MYKVSVRPNLLKQLNYVWKFLRCFVMAAPNWKSEISKDKLAILSRGIFQDLECSYLETSHHHGDYHITFLLGHLVTDAEKHQHVITVCHSHRIQVTQGVGTCYLTLQIKVHYLYAGLWKYKNSRVSKPGTVLILHKIGLSHTLRNDLCYRENELSQLTILWYLSHRRPAKAQVSLHIRAVSPEPLLFTNLKYWSRRRVQPKIRHLAPLDGCACTFEEFYGGRKVS